MRIGQVAVLIAVVMADPGHREGQAILIAAFGNEIELVVRVHDVLGSASVGGVGKFFRMPTWAQLAEIQMRT